VEARKGHTSFICGKHLVVHGGLNNRGNFLNDLLLFDILTLKWSNALLEKNKFYEFGVAYHTSCFVTNQFNRNQEIYKPNEDKSLSQGVYIFGGVDAKNNLVCEFVFLHIDLKPFKFESI
jgi:hypothetical protein